MIRQEDLTDKEKAQLEKDGDLIKRCFEEAALLDTKLGLNPATLPIVALMVLVIKIQD